MNRRLEWEDEPKSEYGLDVLHKEFNERLHGNELNLRYEAWVKEGRALRDLCRELSLPLLPDLRVLYGGGTVVLAKDAEKKGNSCNRHDNCDAADAKARAAGRIGAGHCHDECCEDCFGD